MKELNLIKFVIGVRKISIFINKNYYDNYQYFNSYFKKKYLLL